MAAPENATFSTFVDGGDLTINDIVVGLRNGVNTRFNYSGDLGIYLPLAGGTMSGAINMATNTITGLPSPTNASDATSKTYVDTAIATAGMAFLPLVGGTMSGNINMNNAQKITNAINPTDPQDYATKFYVDQTALNGSSVTAATTATLNATQAGSGVGATLTDASGTFAAFTTDGVSVSVGEKILNKNQTDAEHQGVYTLTTNGDGISIPWVLTRSVTYDTPEQINITGLITIREGSTLAGTQWYNTNTIVTVDTTPFSYAEFGANFVISVNGTANEIDVDNTDAQNPILSLSSTLDFPGTFTVQNTTDIDEILDEDNLGSNSATALATQQSIKAYVDAATSGVALTKTDDTNVTLTLGGTPSTALLQAVSLTLGWIGTLAAIRGGTGQSTYTLGDILYSSATNTLSKLAGNITTAKQYLSQTGNGSISAAPVWSTIAGSDITGAALTKTDDTNVTLTLGGTPTTALLRAASITVGWTGQLGPTRGGTGIGTYTTGDTLYASASNTLSKLAANTSTTTRQLYSMINSVPSWFSLGAVNAQTGTTYTVQLSDYGKLITLNNASPVTVTLPQQSTTATGTEFFCSLLNIGNGLVTIVKQGSETLTGNIFLANNVQCDITRPTTTSWNTFGGTAFINTAFTISELSIRNNSVSYFTVFAEYDGEILSCSQMATSFATADTYTVAINGTPVTGLTAIANTTSKTTTSATGANSFVVGDRITITQGASLLTGVDYGATIYCVRVL